MNKRLTAVLSVVLAMGMFLTASAVFADASENHGESIDSILSEIRGELNLDSSATINPDNVSDESLEKLGEAVMSFRIPNPRQHEWMDKMMGGEGSESLSNMHKLLGYRYLVNGSAAFGPLMMGYGYRGNEMTVRDFDNGRFGGWGQMPMVWSSGYGWIFPVLGLLLIAVLVVLIVLFAKKRNKAYPYGSDVLEKLNERYAKGEITKEEYLRIKKEILV